MPYTNGKAAEVSAMLKKALELSDAVLQGQSANSNLSTVYNAINNNAAIVDAAKAICDVVQAAANDVTKPRYDVTP